MAQVGAVGSRLRGRVHLAVVASKVATVLFERGRSAWFALPVPAIVSRQAHTRGRAGIRDREG